MIVGRDEAGVMLPCAEDGFYNYFAGFRAAVNDEQKAGLDQWIQPKGVILSVALRRKTACPRYKQKTLNEVICEII